MYPGYLTLLYCVLYHQACHEDAVRLTFMYTPGTYSGMPLYVHIWRKTLSRSTELQRASLPVVYCLRFKSVGDASLDMSDIVSQRWTLRRTSKCLYTILPYLVQYIYSCHTAMTTVPKPCQSGFTLRYLSAYRITSCSVDHHSLGCHYCTSPQSHYSTVQSVPTVLAWTEPMTERGRCTFD